MNESEAREIIVEIIADIAPDADLEDLGGSENFRERFGLDSMDFLSIVEDIADQTGVEIPESDYDHVQSLDAMAAYLAGRA